MVPTIEFEEVFDQPPPNNPTDSQWSNWFSHAKRTGTAVIEECGNVSYRTTFEGPNHQDRARAFAQFAQHFQWRIEVEPEKPEPAST
jgi:hypothetical protein